MHDTPGRQKRRHVLVVEWLCSGGLFVDELEPCDMPSLVSQGRRMLVSVCSDFVATGARVVVPVDARQTLDLDTKTHLIQDANSFHLDLFELADQVDQVLVIAPESDGHLETCLLWLHQFEDKWLNPDIEFTRLCSNKNRLQRYFADHGVDVPAGIHGNDWPQFSRSVSGKNGFIVKPVDGCGGENIVFVEAPISGSLLQATNRIEEFVPGVPVSVAVVAQNSGQQILPAMRQVFDGKPVGHFVECVDDLEPAIADRAKRLAKQVVSVLPKTTGYFGIDMVIGGRDVVIEVNPRITMSYPHLRGKVKWNLAELMLDSNTQPSQE